MLWNYASVGQSVRKRQMKGTWQIWKIMLSSSTISGTLGCHFGSNGVAILARIVHICSVGGHSYMSRGANGVTEEFECPLMTPYSLQQQDWCDDRSPGQKTKRVSGLKRTGGGCRCWRGPAGVPLTCVATAAAAAGRKTNLPSPSTLFYIRMSVCFSVFTFQ